MLAPNTAVNSSLSRKAVLVAVNISQWSARKMDKKVTDETNDRYDAAKDAGRYNKLLIAGEHLEEMTSLISKARDLHYHLTQPWTDKGPRILANVLFAKFSDEFRTLKRDFNDAADRFAAAYPGFIAERKEALGKMFKEGDYPAPSEIRSKFKLDTQVLPFPDVADFRSDLDDEAVEAIKAEMIATTANVSDRAMQHTAERILDVVGKMAAKLAEFKPSGGKDDPAEGVFRDTLVENVRELAEVLPAFNLTGDPRLAAITDRIQRELCAEDAVDLRKNDGARAVVQKSADEIVDAVKGLFG